MKLFTNYSIIINDYYVAFKKTDTFEMQANCAH